MKVIYPMKRIYPLRYQNEDLSGRHYENTIFDFCKFTNVNLSKTTFKNCIFLFCDFLETLMTKTKFEGGRIERTIFDNSNLSQAKFEKVSIIETEFPRTILSEAEFLDCDPCHMAYDYPHSDIIFRGASGIQVLREKGESHQEGESS